MNKITYYYGTKAEPTYQRLLNHPFYQPLIDFFLKHQEQRVILRQIKAQFTHLEGFDAFFDEMIKVGLIQRSNRQYQLAFPIFEAAQIKKLKQQAQQACLSLSIPLAEASAVFLGEVIWPLLFPEKTAYFFGVLTEEAEQAPTFYQKNILENGSLSFVSITKKASQTLTLPNYFWALKKGQEVPEYDALTKLLGDVNPDYFIQQANRVIRKIQKQRKINGQQRNIFLESLKLTKVIEQQGESWCFKQLVVAETALSTLQSEHSLLTKEIEKLMQQPTGSAYEQLLYHQFFFGALMTQVKATQLDYVLKR